MQGVRKDRMVRAAPGPRSACALALALASACGAQRAIEATDPASERGPVAGDRAPEYADDSLHEVGCVDESIGQLMLFDEPAPAAIREETRDRHGFETLIDATAGGLTPTQSFVYLALTDDGMNQIELGD